MPAKTLALRFANAGDMPGMGNTSKKNLRNSSALSDYGNRVSRYRESSSFSHGMHWDLPFILPTTGDV